MSRHRARGLMVAGAALALGAAPVIVMQVGGIAGASITLDTAQYVQTTSPSTFVFVPGGGGPSTTQSLSTSGSCKVPSTTSPIIALSALVYQNLVNNAPYTGPASPAKVGTKAGKTGVCALGNPWEIQQNESLIFALGSNPLVNGRTMGEATIPLQLNSNDQTGEITATLIEKTGSTVVGTQSFQYPAANSNVTVDSGQIASGFTSLELQITATDSGNSTTSVVGTTVLSLAQLPQAITFTNTPPASPIVGGSYTVTATGGASGNPVTFSVDPLSTSGCTLTGALVNLNGPAGSCIIDANQAGNATYAPAPQVQQAVTVGRAPQTITFTSTPPNNAKNGDTYTVTATGGPSGNPVTFSIDSSSTSGCTINTTTNLVTFSNPPGSCLVDANQAGNTSYLPAPQAQQPITVFQTLCGQQTIQTQSNDGIDGQINASLTFQDYQNQPAPVDVCKTYTAFTATTNDPIQGLPGKQTVTFSSNPLATAHVTATITWEVESLCTPDGSNNTTQCAPTYVSFDGGATFHVQTYCTSAKDAGIEWCTTSRSYTITPQGTVITEKWDGYGDPVWHSGGETP